jgi:hypothetical protein
MILCLTFNEELKTFLLVLICFIRGFYSRVVRLRSPDVSEQDFDSIFRAED